MLEERKCIGLTIAILATLYGMDMLLGLQGRWYIYGMIEHVLGGLMVGLIAAYEFDKEFYDCIAYAVLVGVLWEFWEAVPVTLDMWGSECFYNDTIMDLICDMGGGLLAAWYTED